MILQYTRSQNLNNFQEVKCKPRSKAIIKLKIIKLKQKNINTQAVGNVKKKICFSLFQRGNQTRTAAYLGNYNNEDIIYQTPGEQVKTEGKVITISLNTSCKNESSI